MNVAACSACAGLQVETAQPCRGAGKMAAKMRAATKKRAAARAAKGKRAAKRMPPRWPGARRQSTHRAATCPNVIVANSEALASRRLRAARANSSLLRP